MITANVIHRVFRIKVGNAEGTAFTIDVDGREYLVTAKHVVSGLGAAGDIEIFSNGVWVPLAITTVGTPQVRSTCRFSPATFD